jgi:L-ascorbate metabolism protein UlaG (beta-lactamase superfamily)
MLNLELNLKHYSTALISISIIKKIFLFLRFLPITLLFFSCSMQKTTDTSSHQLNDFFSQPVNPGRIHFTRFSDNSSSLLIRTSENIILIDPGFLLPADINLIAKHGCDVLIYSHNHGDHYEINTAKAIFQKTSPSVVVEPVMVSALKNEIDQNKLISAEAGHNIKIGDLTIVPITGSHVGPITVFGMKTGSVSIFFGADSGHVPLNGFTADIAFVPTGGASPTCSPEEAAKFVTDLNPDTVIPIHGHPYQDQALKDLMTKDNPEKRVIISKMYEIHSADK